MFRLACMFDAVDVIKLLLLRGAVPHLMDRSGFETLNFKLYQISSTEFELRTNSGATPLIEACINNNEEKVKNLLKDNVDTNATDVFGYTALDYALIYKNEKIIDTLTKNHHALSKKHYNLQRYANKSYHLIFFAKDKNQFIQVLENLEISEKQQINLNEIVDQDGYPILHHFCINLNLTMLIYLIKLNKLDINQLKPREENNKIFLDTPLDIVLGFNSNAAHAISGLLLKNNAVMHPYMILFAIQNGHTAVVKDFFDKHKSSLSINDIVQIYRYFLENDLFEMAKLIIPNFNIPFSTLLLVSQFSKLVDNFLISRLSKDDLNWIKLFYNNGLPLNKMVNISNKALPLLSLASGLGAYEIVAFLADKSDINIVDKDQCTPLSYACEKGHVEVIKCLLALNANVAIVDTNGTSVLMHAFNIRNLDTQLNVVNMLLEHDNRLIRIADKGPATPLYRAYQKNNAKLFELLLRYIDNIDEEYFPSFFQQLLNDDDNTKLLDLIIKKFPVDIAFLACTHKDILLLKHVFQTNKNVTVLSIKDNKSLIQIACESGDTAILEFLLALPSNINININHDLLEITCQHGHLAATQLLLKFFGIKDLDKLINNKQTLLHIASQFGHLDIIKWLVESKVNIDKLNSDQKSAIAIASEEGHIDIVEFLIGKKAKLDRKNKDGLLPIHVAFSADQFLITDMLLSAMKKSSYQLNQALIIACEQGQIYLMRQLLEAGADIHSLKENGDSLLHIAIKNQNPEVTSFLLDLEVDINQLNNDQKDPMAPLHIACSNGNTELINLLIENKADVNLKTEQGVSPLAIACKFNKPENVKILINAGADISQENTHDNRTALDIARDRGFTDIIKLLDPQSVTQPILTSNMSKASQRLFAETHDVKSIPKLKTSKSRQQTQVVPSVESQHSEPPVFKWADKQLSTEMTEDVHPVRKTNDRLFIYCPPDIMAEINSLDPQLAKAFNKMIIHPKMTTEVGPGIKFLSHSMPKVNFDIKGYKGSKELKYELKIKGSTDRLLGFEINSEVDGEGKTASLIIFCIFKDKGLHKSADSLMLKHSLSSKVFNIQLPSTSTLQDENRNTI